VNAMSPVFRKPGSSSLRSAHFTRARARLPLKDQAVPRPFCLWATRRPPLFSALFDEIGRPLFFLA
jgi:hypothetical protein